MALVGYRMLPPDSACCAHVGLKQSARARAAVSLYVLSMAAAMRLDFYATNIGNKLKQIPAPRKQQRNRPTERPNFTAGLVK
jgi:hypothetical protein